MKRDYYQVLGVEKDATPEDVKKAFRKLAFQHHPDRNNENGAEGRFKEINEAYQVLSDTEKRATYDRVGHVDGANVFGRGFEGFEYGGLGDIFDAFFGANSTAGSRTPQRGTDLRAELSISFEEAVFGCERELQMTRMEGCPDCRGSGAEKGTKPETCSNCGGTGRVQRVERSIFGRFVNVVSCDKCRGTGKVITRLCPRCSGAGREKNLRRLTVVVPPGVDGSCQLRLSNEGSAGAWGGPCGDLYVQLAVGSHQLFKRDGPDILYTLPLNFAQAALGDKVEVPTIDGMARLDIHAGTQNGELFRIAGRGAPKPGGGKRGDHLVKVSVVTPTALDESQRQLFEELKRSLNGGEVAQQEQREGKSILDRIKGKF
ncbi:MAG: molecular chaperone DnaJ [Dehalococcoidia bacterium]|nr:molecular chaperone DnaJ [Dehalococcoidia bacterium]